jgi:hypothetical protein
MGLGDRGALVLCDRMAGRHLTFAKNVNKAKGTFSNKLKQFYAVCYGIFGRGRCDWITA